MVIMCFLATIMLTFLLGVADCAGTEQTGVFDTDTDCPSLCNCEDDGMLLHVDCVDLGLTELPSKLSVFTSYLDLSMNNLTLLPNRALSNLHFLQELRLAGNDLTDIPEGAFSGLFNLKVLMLQNNHLKQVPSKALENLKNLQSLRLDANQIASVPESSFRGLASLRHLWLDDNTLTEVPVHALAILPTLQAVTLALNSITHIPDHAFANLTSLVVLHLHNNQIQSLGDRCFDGLLSLETLDLNYNDLAMFPTAIRALPNLKELSFHSNNIRSVPEQAFVGNPSLITIYFYDNPIQFVDKSAFQHLPALRMLSLNGATDITEFPDLTGTNSLETLAVTGTHISSLPGTLCDQLPNLIQLDLSHNLIQHLPSFSGCRKIQKIDLSSNLLSSVPMEGFQDLTHLRLAGNTALRHTLPVQRLPKLRVVEMPYAFQCCAFVPGENSKSPYIWKTENIKDARDQNNFLVESEVDARPQHSVHCSPAQGPFQSCQSLFGSWLVRVAVWIIVILSLVSNSLVLVSIALSSKSPTSPTQHLLGVLAWVHLLNGVSSAALAVLDGISFDHYTDYGEWWEGGPGCWIFDFLSVFSSEASVFLLTAVVLDRGCTVRGSQWAETEARKIPLGWGCAQGISALCCFLAGAIAALPPLTMGEYEVSSLCVASPYGHSSRLGYSYATALVLLNSLCYLLMIAIYTRHYCHMDRDTAEKEGVTVQEYSVTKLMACLLFTNCLLSFPVTLPSFSSLLQLSSPKVAKAILLFVGPLPSCLDPLLYMLLSPHFREDLSRLLYWTTHRLKKGQRRPSLFSVNSEDMEKQSCDAMQALVSLTL
ncbi:leucine-rich repeat-containing G-protein coupled receptor 5-like [Salvelinus fontinalis]|uniref:leucine-rich repeat-containing G-protein coupled receptor 5-like n=1 Tax=Salvelinus fontinalis TaxID=8038 RepID=UPI002485C6BC|nr:leucine-rich repeat-containing G-protein coupled receptor 5-like [Salvelinus fontinalis]